MKIGVIGAGNIGGTLVRRLRALGHDVFIANSRGPETLAGLAKETGAKPVTVSDAARGRPVRNAPPRHDARRMSVLLDGRSANSYLQKDQRARCSIPQHVPELAIESQFSIRIHCPRSR